MATTINITDLTNTTAVTNGITNGTGVVDKLMNTVNLYIEDQYDKGRLKGPEYSQVLLGSIQAVLQNSVQFALQEKLIAAQVDGALKDNVVKDQQLINLKVEQIIKDKEAANLGLDEVVKTANNTPEAVYTPKYI